MLGVLRGSSLPVHTYSYLNKLNTDEEIQQKVTKSNKPNIVHFLKEVNKTQ